MTYYLGAHVCQFDHGPYAGQNCAPSSLAMAVDQVTGGHIQRTGSEVRALIPRSEETNPATPGWSMHDVDRAAAKLGIDFTDSSGSLWRQLRALHLAGRGIVLSGDSDQFTAGCSDAFDGDHCIYIPAGEPGVAGQWRYGDPICRQWTWASEVTLQRYAEKFGRKVHGTSTPQPITFGYTAEVALVAPPTDTEEDMGLSLTLAANVSTVAPWSSFATATVKGTGHSAIRVSDRVYKAVAAGYNLGVVQYGRLMHPLDALPGDRSSVVVTNIGGEQYAVLVSDITATPLKPPATSGTAPAKTVTVTGSGLVVSGPK